GYLITQVLLAPSDAPLAARLAQFYLRRCRRIVPALLVLMIIVTPLAAVISPGDLSSYGRYLASTTVALTNVVAWRDGGAWPPLAHLWTIAVEEQFYLAYPLLLLMVCGHSSSRAMLVIPALAAGSFAVCIWASYATAVAGFYLTPARAWELLLGASIAVRPIRISNTLLRELSALLSL